MSCGVGHRCGSDPALPWLCCRPAAIAPIRPLAWEPPCAAGSGPRKGKKDQKKKKVLFVSRGLVLIHPPRCSSDHNISHGPLVEEASSGNIHSRGSSVCPFFCSEILSAKHAVFWSHTHTHTHTHAHSHTHGHTQPKSHSCPQTSIHPSWAEDPPVGMRSDMRADVSAL